MEAARDRNSELLAFANSLNGCFLDVIDSVATVRAELAVTLQRIVESYNSVIVQQFECFHSLKLTKEKRLESKFAELRYEQQATLGERDLLLKK